LREGAGANGWLLAEVEREDGPVLVRMRDHVPEEAVRADFPMLVRVAWPLSEPPSEGALEAMVAMENAVYAALGRDGGAIGVAVVTADEGRDWLFYTADPDAFVRQFSAALREHPVYPVELTAGDDPDWSAFFDLMPRGLLH
jgi:hypothetical protein